MTPPARLGLLAFLTLLALLVAMAPLAAAQGGSMQQGPVTMRFAPIPGLEIETDVDGYLDVMPGATRTVNATVRNAGNQTLTLSVHAEQPAPPDAPRSLTAALHPDNVTLESGANATIRVEVTANATAEEGTNTTLMLRFSRGEESAMEPIPIHLGGPCEGCTPPQAGGQFFIGGPGAGPGSSTSTGGTRVTTRAPSAAGNGTSSGPTSGATPGSPSDDPYQEVPGPGLVLALAGVGGALLLRSRRATVFVVLTLALATPLALAQSTATDRTFALVKAAREGGDVVVDLHVVRGQPYRITVSLYSGDGRLVAPEQVTDIAYFNTATSYRFREVNATSLEVRVQFTRSSGTQAEESFPFTLPPAPMPQLEVVSAEWGPEGPFDLRLRVANFGAENAMRLTAHLEDGTGTRLGEPLARATSLLAPDAAWDLAFSLAEAHSALTLVLDHDDGTQRLPVRLPEIRNGSRLELVEFEYHEDGAARFVLVNLEGATMMDAVAYVETDGSRVGSPSIFSLGALARGERHEASFQLPDDLQKATLVVAHENGTLRFPVLLEASESAGSSSLELETDLPARDAAPGDTATYSVKITNDGDETLATLRVDGLPDGYSAAFTVAGSSVRSVGLPAGATRDVTVAIAAPSSATDDVGRTLDLDVVATASDGDEASVALALTLLGEGKLELSGQNWFADGEPGGTERVTLTVKNAGSATVRDVEVEATKPTGWTVTFDPGTIDALQPGESRAVVMTVEAASDAGAGRYTLDVAASSPDLTTRPRSLVVEIAAESSSKLPWVLGAAFAGLAAVALVVKMRRK